MQAQGERDGLPRKVIVKARLYFRFGRRAGSVRYFVDDPCVMAVTAVGKALDVYGEFCEFSSVPSVEPISNPERLLPRKLAV